MSDNYSGIEPDYAALRCGQVERLKDHQIPEVEVFRKRLQGMPFISIWDMVVGALNCESETVLENIPVDRIVGCMSGNSWDMIDRALTDVSGTDYTWDLAQKIKRGDFLVDSDNPDVHLEEIGGLYFVTDNGRHRIAAMKGFVGSSCAVKAWVTRPIGTMVINGTVRPGLVTLKNGQFHFSRALRRGKVEIPGSLPILEMRRREGLWQGSLRDIGVDIKPKWRRRCFGETVRRASWVIDSTQGSWAFAVDMEKVQRVCQAVL